jgi:hypothetical protein
MSSQVALIVEAGVADAADAPATAIGVALASEAEALTALSLLSSEVLLSVSCKRPNISSDSTKKSRAGRTK